MNEELKLYTCPCGVQYIAEGQEKCNHHVDIDPPVNKDEVKELREEVKQLRKLVEKGNK